MPAFLIVAACCAVPIIGAAVLLLGARVERPPARGRGEEADAATDLRVPDPSELAARRGAKPEKAER